MSFSIELIAVAKLKKNSPFYSLFEDYRKRLHGKFTLHELEAHTTADEQKKILDKISDQGSLIVLDETGKSFPSIKFAQRLEQLQIDKSSGPIQFVIGGADGLSEDILKRADSVISFGQQTWPHMMVRVMLIEQIYRAQQILAGHPYHRQ